jgi:hypothetical protein
MRPAPASDFERSERLDHCDGFEYSERLELCEQVEPAAAQ